MVPVVEGGSVAYLLEHKLWPTLVSSHLLAVGPQENYLTSLSSAPSCVS